jgi:NAD(P)-dependent dehydrogenase (short-subunit alcohol dehydrogenase family)
VTPIPLLSLEENVHEQFDLTDRVALVTGASKGLGKAMARGLARAGADVFVVSRNENELRASLEEILDSTGRRGGYAVADLAERGAPERVVQAAVFALGKIDILVSNAGGNTPQPIGEVTEEVWDEMLAVHLTGSMALARAVAPLMKEQRWGRIVFTTSVLAFTSIGGRNAYSAVKAGLTGLARASAIDLGPYGITVNCLSPGPFPTELVLRNFPSAEAKQAMLDRTALGRFGEPADLVGPLLLLSSDAGRYMTGTTLVVDGGWLAR